eukprot:1179380-Prorocentrum_minimum.AAC.2
MRGRISVVWTKGKAHAANCRQMSIKSKVGQYERTDQPRAKSSLFQLEIPGAFQGVRYIKGVPVHGLPNDHRLPTMRVGAWGGAHVLRWMCSPVICEVGPEGVGGALHEDTFGTGAGPRISASSSSTVLPA